MTLFECYEKRRGALYSRLTQAKSLAEGSAALTDALDAILYDYSAESADDASRRLAAVALQMDKNLDARASELAAKKADARAQGLSADELELMTTLLEGAYSDSGEIALESLEDVGHYLRRKGIETLEYDGKDEHYFELLPGDKSATLRPALLCDGRLIKKGLATYAEEGAR